MKPIVFFDLETTGTNVESDRIIEIACIKINPSGVREEFYRKINPGILIPKEATEVHGITDEMVKNCSSFSDIANELAAYMTECDVAGYNIKRFDLPLLIQEFDRAKLEPIDCSTLNIVDCCKLYFMKEPRDLKAAAKYYAGIDNFDAHKAMVDVETTIAVMDGILEKYDDIGITPAEISNYINKQDRTVDLSGKFTKDKNDNVCYNFGKHYGKQVFTEIDYLKWMISTNMPKDTLKMANKLLQEHTRKMKIKTWFENTDIAHKAPGSFNLYMAVSERLSKSSFQIKVKDNFTEIIYDQKEDAPLVLTCTADEKYLLCLVDEVYRQVGGIELAKASYDNENAG